MCVCMYVCAYVCTYGRMLARRKFRYYRYVVEIGSSGVIQITNQIWMNELRTGPNGSYVRRTDTVPSLVVVYRRQIGTLLT